MHDRSFLDWPFFDEQHRALAGDIRAWCDREITGLPHDDTDQAAVAFVRSLGAAGWLRHCVPAPAGASERLDVRTLCVIRETLARHDALADFAFALQGLGGAPIALFGDDEARARYLPGIVSGERVAAFALSEPDAGSDVAAISTSARQQGDGYALDGTKTWISNAGLAHQYVVFARSDGAGMRGLSAFIVDADAPGLTVTERIDMIAPHPLGTLRFDGCTARLLGARGQGAKIALATLDIFRATVGAAAVGLARRALEESTARVRTRSTFGQPLARHQMVQEKIADMALELDASALLVYRAAWAKDNGAERVTREAAMAKLFATEAAQRAADSAVQLFGGLGVMSGTPVERLYREVRALRIYEGTSEIQKLVIAEHVIAAAGGPL